MHNSNSRIFECVVDYFTTFITPDLMRAKKNTHYYFDHGNS